MSHTISHLIVATHNAGKLREIAELLADLQIQVASAASLGLPEPDETGATFLENAQLKSRAAALATGQHALADDSGLCVPALHNAPGIYSARWAGPEKNFNMAMQKIHDELTATGHTPHGTPAFFVCVLSLAAPDGTTRDFTGEVHGTLTFPPRGGRGFGYDPIFIPNGHAITFAEMDPAEKHHMSHRARAFAQFKKFLEAAHAA